VLMLVAMMLTPPTPPSHLFLEFVLSSLAAASDEQYESIPDDEIPCWLESFTPCTGSARRGGDHLGTALSVVTPPTSSPTAPRGKSSTPPPTSMNIPSGTITTRAMIRTCTASGTTRRRSSKR
jgi:hypothetical protein